MAGNSLYVGLKVVRGSLNGGVCRRINQDRGSVLCRAEREIVGMCGEMHVGLLPNGEGSGSARGDCEQDPDEQANESGTMKTTYGPQDRNPHECPNVPTATVCFTKVAE